MKVPQYERQVDVKTPQQGFTPVKEGTVPDVLPAAYEIEVGQVTEQAGKTLRGEAENLAAHYDKMMLDNEHKDNLRRETAFRQDLNNVLYNPETESVNIRGEDIERPKGIMLRTLSKAEGATVQARQAYQQLREKYVSGISARQASTLAPALDNHFIAEDENVIKHEVSQLNADMKDAFESNLKQTILDIAPNRDPQMLKNTLDAYDKKVGPYNTQFNKVTQKLNVDEGKLKIVNSNIEDLLLTYDQKQAQSFLDSVKESMSPEVYNAATKNLTTKAMAVEAQKRYLNLMYGEQNHDTIMNKIKDGTLSFKDIDDQWAIPEDQGGIKRETLITYQNALKTHVKSDLSFITGQKTKNYKGKAVPTKGAEQASKFILDINGLIDDDTDRWKAREIIAKMYADGSATGEECAFLNTLTKRFDDIKFNRSSGFWIDSLKKIKSVLGQQNASNGEIVIAIKSLINSTNSGVSPVDGATAAIKQFNVSSNPHVAMASEKGTEMLDPYGNISLVFPDGTVDDQYQSARKARKSENNKEKNK